MFPFDCSSGPLAVANALCDLPEDRVAASHSFKVTGLDFCGPFYYKNPIRNKAPIKCYICIFIYFSTKAVHLELVQDLYTSVRVFLNALRRFILTRGKHAAKNRFPFPVNGRSFFLRFDFFAFLLKINWCFINHLF